MSRKENTNNGEGKQQTHKKKSKTDCKQFFI